MSLKKLLILIAATVSLIAAAPSAVADKLEDIIQSGRIRIAVPADFPPFGSIDKDGQAPGYDVEVARSIAARVIRAVQFMIGKEQIGLPEQCAIRQLAAWHDQHATIAIG